MITISFHLSVSFSSFFIIHSYFANEMHWCRLICSFFLFFFCFEFVTFKWCFCHVINIESIDEHFDISDDIQRHFHRSNNIEWDVFSFINSYSVSVLGLIFSCFWIIEHWLLALSSISEVIFNGACDIKSNRTIKYDRKNMT